MITEIKLRVQLRFDPDTETLHEVQQRFLDSLLGNGLWHAEIVEGLVDKDDVPVT